MSDVSKADELIAMAREPRLEDQAEAAGKYYALMVVLADALEAKTGVRVDMSSAVGVETQLAANQPGEDERAELKRHVFEALGAASRCWDDEGVFLSEDAERIGDGLIAKIEDCVPRTSVHGEASYDTEWVYRARVSSMNSGSHTSPQFARAALELLINNHPFEVDSEPVFIEKRPRFAWIPVEGVVKP